MNPLRIDGAHGEGGGQTIRTSVALAALLGQQTIVENIRLDRDPPGLQATHLNAIRSIARLAGASLSGDVLGSTRLLIDPAVESSGASSKLLSSRTSGLVVQTVLGPALAVAKVTTRVLTKSAPTPEKVHEVFVATLARHGWPTRFELGEDGDILAASESDLGAVAPFRLTERGPLTEVKVFLSHHDVDATALDSIERALRDVMDREAPSTPLTVWRRRRDYERDGAAVTSVLYYDGGSLADDGAAPGDELAQLADERAQQLRKLLRSDAPVDENLADQLVLPAAWCAATTGRASTYRITEVSEHLRTVLWLVERFLPVSARLTEEARRVDICPL